MFAFYKIINKNNTHLEIDNLEFYKKCNSLHDFKLSINQRISKYSLMKNGWCFISHLDESGTTPLYIVLDTDSDRILNTNLVPLFRDLKLQEILEY